MSSGDNLIVDAASKLFQDLADPQSINNSKDNEWQPALWAALEESGLTLTWIPDELGGAGATLADGFQVLQLTGEYAIPVPLAETLLAGWILTHAGLQVPAGRLTVAPVSAAIRLILQDNNTLQGVSHGIPFARTADHIVSIAHRDERTFIVVVEAAACTIEPTNNLAGEPRDTVVFDDVSAHTIAATELSEDTFYSMGAALRAMQMAGALQKILDLCVQYAGERIAFGRPIAKFQAIQHNLARLAGEAAAALAAAGSAAYAIAENTEDNSHFTANVLFEIAAAKIRVGEAAGEGAAIAHQLHGAIGFTQEHILHRFTHRLWSWRDDFGSEAEWAVRLGHQIIFDGADELWPTVTSI